MNNKTRCSLIILTILFCLAGRSVLSAAELSDKKTITITLPLDSIDATYDPTNIQFRGLVSQSSDDSLIVVFASAIAYANKPAGNNIQLPDVTVILDTIAYDKKAHSLNLSTQEMKNLYLGVIDSIIGRQPVQTELRSINGDSYPSLRRERQYKNLVYRYSNGRFTVREIYTWGDSQPLWHTTILFILTAAGLGIVFPCLFKNWKAYYQELKQKSLQLLVPFVVILIIGITIWVFIDNYRYLPDELVLTHYVILFMAMIIGLIIGFNSKKLYLKKA